MVKNSELGVNRTLKQLGIHKRTFYNWYHAYSQNGIDGLKAKRNQKQQWNSIPDRIKQMVVEIALQYPQETPRLIATRFIDEQGVFISESSVYRILKKQGLLADTPHRFLAAADQFHSKTNFVHQMWQTDFTYFKIIGWGWYYLSTVIDDYSRYIVHWELCPSMTAQNVKRTIDNAISKAKIKNRKQPPVLLSDNGPCYIAKELKDYLMDTYGIRHIHGKPLHPQTQGKIERYHRSMKNVVKLHHYYAPEQLERAIDKFVQYYNSQRYHEALNNLTPEDVYLGRQDQILKLRKQVKINTLNQRKLNYCFGLI
ncbi:transposase [Ornithobacterium rhinotracheale DSM 15997]|uniref:Transposase n=3 Tax=Ornithobacterium rhinotracheale TaxID=28251 RepID=I4A1T8_ORNRL|nr:transposase [Ornithobacterium rhinotracheale DSM 15997]